MTAWLSVFESPSTDDADWAEYLGGPDRNHYSSLAQINTTNAAQLKIAWEYHTNDSGQIQCNPISKDGVLFGMTASTQPFAIDAATGQLIWQRTDTTASNGFSTSRGVAYWENAANGEDKRILFTNGQWLYAINAHTGEPILSFGQQGRTSLKAGLGPQAQQKMVISNTPGTIFGDLIIMPLRVSEGPDAALGHIQAFNIRTGKLSWVFHTIPHPGELGYETWPKNTYMNSEVGAANNWAGMAIDRKRGIVYVPTGSAAFDYYGGNRTGQNLFANCLLALDARTGKRIWHYQFVHHDIIDRDPPAPPNLVTITRHGKRIDAVAQVTKQGFVFVFDRDTGKPVFPINEVPAPATDVLGEQAWKTQPIPTKPAPYARQTLTEADINPDAVDRDTLVATFRKHRFEGPFTPLTQRGTIVFPGLDGGAEWGGAAADPDGILYVNSNEMAWLLKLTDKQTDNQLAALSAGQRIYSVTCAACHGAGRTGNPASGYPSLRDIGNRRNRDYVASVISTGKGRMPAFTQLTPQDKQALLAFLFGEEKQEPGLNVSRESRPVRRTDPSARTPGKLTYRIGGFAKFLDKNGYPAIRPPWGTLNAIDLNTGEYIWKKPFGEYPELSAKGIAQTGSESYGGPVVTAGGVLFIAGTKDRKFRVYEKKTGKLLWQTELPAAGFATPATYLAKGKQYVVVACGGTKLGAKKGDSYVAFALP
ncbi:PQQ-binding-like beta-propeller repeat protein [Spirosoma sp. KNUC1025]|nr:PQQ-binding-like beta-propeller repeat protein [Spirosoma sp. KNUC1025]